MMIMMMTTMPLTGLKGGCGGVNYRVFKKKLFSQSSSQIEVQDVPGPSRWIEHNPDYSQFSDPVPVGDSEPTLPSPS